MITSTESLLVFFKIKDPQKSNYFAVETINFASAEFYAFRVRTVLENRNHHYKRIHKKSTTTFPVI